MTMLILDANSEAEQEAIGGSIAKAVHGGCVIYLYGDLGTGKTTLARGFLRALGHVGAVKSPTYTLLEPYQLATRTVLHLDLYRLSAPEECEYLGLEDLAGPDTVWLLEWPERGDNFLPPADVQIKITHQSWGRRLAITALSTVGTAVLTKLQYLQDADSKNPRP